MGNNIAEITIGLIFIIIIMIGLFILFIKKQNANSASELTTQKNGYESPIFDKTFKVNNPMKSEDLFDNKGHFNGIVNSKPINKTKKEKPMNWVRSDNYEEDLKNINPGPLLPEENKAVVSHDGDSIINSKKGKEKIESISEKLNKLDQTISDATNTKKEEPKNTKGDVFDTSLDFSKGRDKERKEKEKTIPISTNKNRDSKLANREYTAIKDLGISDLATTTFDKEAIINKIQTELKAKKEKNQKEDMIEQIDKNISKTITMENKNLANNGNEYFNILVVDDSFVVRKKIGDLLKKQGYKVTLKNDGWEAFNFLTTVEKNNRPDLLITDIEMPNMDGVKLIEAVVKQNFLSSIPIIVVSAHVELHLPLTESGNIDGFLPKPFDDKLLIEQVEYLLNV